MKYDKTGRRALRLIEIEADRTITGIEAMLPLDRLDPAEAVAMAERVAGQLRSLPPEERRTAIVNTALAIADLERLCETLTGQRDELGDEITRIKTHAAAINAYRRGWTIAAGKR